VHKSPHQPPRHRPPAPCAPESADPPAPRAPAASPPETISRMPVHPNRHSPIRQIHNTNSNTLTHTQIHSTRNSSEPSPDCRSVSFFGRDHGAGRRADDRRLDARGRSCHRGAGRQHDRHGGGVGTAVAAAPLERFTAIPPLFASGARLPFRSGSARNDLAARRPTVARTSPTAPPTHSHR
jgi:hypothetical protein